MRLMRYEGSAIVVSATGLLGSYAKGAEAKGKIELRGDATVLQTLKGSAEARCKLDSVTKFAWLLKAKNYEWTEWFPVQLNGSPIVMLVDSANGSARIEIVMSADMKNMVLNGKLTVKNALYKMFVTTADISGQATKTYEGDLPDPEPPEPGPGPQPGNDIPPISSRTYRSGDKDRDGGQEIADEQRGMQIRYNANDGDKIRGIGSPFYFMSGVVRDAGAFSIVWNADGSATVTGKDFVSSRSGLKYAFLGWTIQYSASPLVTKYTITVPKSQCNEALRGYWATVN